MAKDEGTGKREDMKWDKGKLKYHLILVGFLRLMAEILTKGEINHPKVDGKPSWMRVEPEAYLDAIFRHLEAYRYDPDSLDRDMKTHHMGHIAVNAMFLWFFSVAKGFNGGLTCPPYEEEVVDND